MQRMRTDGTGRQRRAVSSIVVAATIAAVAVGTAVFIAILAAMGTDREYTGTAKPGALETAETTQSTQSTIQMPVAETGASTSLAAVESNAKACAEGGKKSGACLAGGGVIIHGAGVQGILEPSEIERSFDTDLPAQWRDAVREAIEAVEYLPGGGA